MDAAPTPSPSQAYAPELSRRLGIIVATLRLAIGRGFAKNRHLDPFGMPLWNRISRILRRFDALMALLATGRLPRRRRGPHTGGAPHPENLRRDPLPTTWGWLLFALGWEVAGCREQLERLLAEPASAELLAKVPAAERILRPLRRMLGGGPYDPTRRPRKGGRTSAAQSADATIPAPAPPAVAPPPPSPPPVPHERPVMTSRGLVWVRDPPLPTRLIRHSIV